MYSSSSSSLCCHIQLAAHATITQQSFTVTGSQKHTVHHSWQLIISNITNNEKPVAHSTQTAKEKKNDERGSEEKEK